MRAVRPGSLVVDDPDVFADRRRSDGDGAHGQFTLRRIGVEGEVAAFGRARPAAVDASGQQAFAQGRDVCAVDRLAAGGQQADTVERVARCEVGDPGTQQRRGAVHRGGRLRGEPGTQSGGAASSYVPEEESGTVEQRHQEGVDACTEAEWQQDSRTLARTEAEDVAAVTCLVHPTPLPVHYALGPAGGSGGEDQHGGVVGLGFEHRSLRRRQRGDLLRVERPCSGEFQDVRAPVLRQEWIEGDHRVTGAQHGEQGDHRLDVGLGRHRHGNFGSADRRGDRPPAFRGTLSGLTERDGSLRCGHRDGITEFGGDLLPTPGRRRR